MLQTIVAIVFDGWSQGTFNREFMMLYGAYRQGRENPLKPLGVQYADFAIWQRKWVEEGGLNRGLDYWRQQLAGIPERLDLPTDRARPAVQTFEAEACQMTLTASQVMALRRVSQQSQATLYMSLMAAFGLLLSRYKQTGSVVVGSPIANRQEAKMVDLIRFL